MTTLTKIGNSYGVRIPKVYIEKAHLFNSQIDFEVLENGLLLRPNACKSRSEWAENIEAVLQKNEAVVDEAIDSGWLNDSDLDEWEW